MYKVTLFDYNCPSCTSGVAEFYTENINKFKEEWFKLESDEKRKQRFLQSLGGEMVTDYYSDSPDLNIVQEDKDVKVIKTENIHYDDEEFTLVNGYGWEGKIFVRKADFSILYIYFQGRYMAIGSYKLSGVASYDEEGGYHRQFAYGNRVLKVRWNNIKVYNNYNFFQEHRGNLVYKSDDLNVFKNDTIESICYFPLMYFESLQELQGFKVTKDRLELMMEDILGDAG